MKNHKLFLLSLLIPFMFAFKPSEKQRTLTEQNSFCYWDTQYSNDTSLINATKTNHYYIRYFDVDWDDVSQEAKPIASISTYGVISVKFTPSVFLTNKVFEKSNKKQLQILSQRIKKRVEEITADFGHKAFCGEYGYPTLEYFDYNATTSDIDQLINLLEKKDKTAFEEYLCNQPFAPINAYKDLKGTIAFRNNDLQLAYKTFSSMPKDYWQKSNGLYFSDYLNEDPFVAKGLRDAKYRKFDYKFNKADFVKQLIDLQKQAETDKNSRADCYIKLGNAFFNTSYFGNSWMMSRYNWSTEYEYYADNMECLPQWYRDYLTAAVARKYFEMVLKEAANDEQIAYASLMLYHIYRSQYYAGWERRNYGDCMNLAKQHCQQFFRYQNTTTFRMYECPGMKAFLF